MKIQELFDHLSYGEFSQLSIGGLDPGVIDESNYARVVSYIQLGLTALYKRFKLKEGRLSFAMVPAADRYVLDADDFLKVERVILDSGIELTMNDHTALYGCFTPAMNTLRLSPAFAAQGPDMPDALKTANLLVAYRANHPKIMGASGILIAQTKTIELPSSHVEALLYFVASRVNNPVGMSNEFHAGNSWYAKYENECKRLEADGYAIHESEHDSRFEDRGWV